jgi:GDP-L-fucose synthase
MHHYNESGLVNIGTGIDLTITELALMVKDVVGFEGMLTYDASKPDGTPRKLLDVSRLSALGWNYKIKLRQGLEMVYKDYQSSVSSV